MEIPIAYYNVSFNINDSLADKETQNFDFDTSYSGKYEDNMEIITVDLEKNNVMGTVTIIKHEIVTAISDRESMLRETQEYMKVRGWTDIKPIRRQIAGKDASVVMATDKDGELRDMTQFWFKLDKYRELVGTLYFVGNNATETLDSFKLIQIIDTKKEETYNETNETKTNIKDAVQPVMIIIDDRKEQTITTNRPLKLAEGYVLQINHIDIDGNKVYLDLLKDDKVVDSKIVSPSKDNPTVEDKIYRYKKDIGNSKNVTLIEIHFKNAFRGSDLDLGTISSVMQISENLNGQ